MTTRDTVMEFEVLLEPDEDGFHVWCPVLEGCHSFGLTKVEALENIKEAIELWLEGEDELGLLMPERETVRVAIP